MQVGKSTIFKGNLKIRVVIIVSTTDILNQIFYFWNASSFYLECFGDLM
jgi:hypothetical protein